MPGKPMKILPEVTRSIFKKAATVAYPFEKVRLYEGYRARIAFDVEKCIGCKMCMRVCPAKAIEIILAENQPQPQIGADGKPVPVKKIFNCIMNLDRCIYCAQCVEICPKKALSCTQDFELAQIDKKKLRLHYK